MLIERLHRFIEGGISLMVGTVDAAGVPTCCRAIALTSKDDFQTVTVYVPVATGQEIVANVATTRRVAIACSHPIDHSGVQIKGVTRGVRIAGESERAFVHERLLQFADIVDQVGLPRRITHTMATWPAFAIDVSIEETYDQSPGPKAGEPLR